MDSASSEQYEDSTDVQRNALSIDITAGCYTKPIVYSIFGEANDANLFNYYFHQSYNQDTSKIHPLKF